MLTYDGSLEDDLTLMSLRPEEIASVDDDTWWDYLDQLAHLCIRSAWRKAFLVRAPVRKCLHVMYAKRYIAAVRARGFKVDPLELLYRIEELRELHEMNLCFGFFVNAEAERIFNGAVDRNYPSDLSIFTPSYLGMKKGELNGYGPAAELLRRLRKLLALNGRPNDEYYRPQTVLIVGSYARAENQVVKSRRLEELIQLAEQRAASQFAFSRSCEANRKGLLTS